MGTVLVGYVSDERFLALGDALIELCRGGESVAVVRSTPRGAVYADILPGEYEVTLSKEGYGSKTIPVQLVEGKIHQFRLVSENLFGYAWPKWVKSGDEAEYRIHTLEDTQVSLWRYGRQKECIRMLGWHDEHAPKASAQLTPDGDYTQTGVGWNRIGYEHSHPQRVEAPAESGLYYFHLKGKSGAFFSFPWIVAPRTPQAQVAVVAGTNTWNAYNNFGGRSNYVNVSRLPDRPVVHSRSELDRYQRREGSSVYRYQDHEYMPLAFERPEWFSHIPEETRLTDPIEGRQECHTAPAEWRFLGLLEREGYDYDLYADHQLHTGELDLSAYKVLIIQCHPEYWSRTMYTRVKEWVFEQGGRLMYLGGNGINCEVEFQGDIEAGSLAMRCLNYHAEVDDGGNPPADMYESRFHRRVESEANLLGVVYSRTGIMTAAPYRVVDPSHWVFAGTGLNEGALFGEASLHERCHGGASGHETDKRSPHSPSGVHLLAKGTNPDNGGAEMIIYDTESNGAVFSVGSITYPAGILLDDNLSKVTANVLERFLAGE